MASLTDERGLTWASWALTLSLVCVGALASAQATFEERYREALAFRAQHRDAEALAIFSRLEAEAHDPRALAQMALAEGALGRWVDAEVHLTDALARGGPWIERQRATLTAALATISEHLGNLDIVCPIADAELLVNGRRLGTLPLPRPMRVEAGTVTVEVRASGHLPTARIITVAPGGASREVFSLARVPEPVTVPVATRPSDASSPLAAQGTRQTDVRPPAESSTRRTVGWWLLGGAGVSLAGGITAFLVGREQIDQYNADLSCPGEGAPSQPRTCADRLATSNAMQVLTFSALGLSSALLGVSIYLLVTPGSSRTSLSTGRPEERAPSVLVGPGSLHVRVAF